MNQENEQQPEAIIDCPTCGRRLRVTATKEYIGYQRAIESPRSLPSMRDFQHESNAKIEPPKFKVVKEYHFNWPGAVLCRVCRTTIELNSYRTCENPSGSVVVAGYKRFTGTIKGRF